MRGGEIRERGWGGGARGDWLVMVGVTSYIDSEGGINM